MEKISRHDLAWDFIKDHHSAFGTVPGPKAITDHFGWSPSSGSDVLTALVTTGKLRIGEREMDGRRWRYRYEIAD